MTYSGEDKLTSSQDYSQGKSIRYLGYPAILLSVPFRNIWKGVEPVQSRSGDPTGKGPG